MLSFQIKAPGEGHPQAQLHQLPRRPQRQRPLQYDVMTVQPAEEQQLLPQEPDGGDSVEHRDSHFRGGRRHGPRTGTGACQDTGSAGRASHDGRVHPTGGTRERGDIRGQHRDVKGADSRSEAEKREKLMNFSSTVVFTYFTKWEV